MNQEPSIFTKIINREIPAEIVWENERIIVIKDIKQDAPVHLLGITKVPYKNIDDLVTNSTEKDLLWELFSVLAECARKMGIEESGYRLVNNNGADAHQIVPHLHVHLVGGAPLNAE